MLGFFSQSAFVKHWRGIIMKNIYVSQIHRLILIISLTFFSIFKIPWQFPDLKLFSDFKISLTFPDPYEPWSLLNPRLDQSRFNLVFKICNNFVFGCAKMNDQSWVSYLRQLNFICQSRLRNFPQPSSGVLNKANISWLAFMAGDCVSKTTSSIKQVLCWDIVHPLKLFQCSSPT